MTKWKRIAVKLGLTLGSLLLAALLLEVGVLVLLGEQVKFPRHVVGTSWGLRTNEPNAVYRHKSADVTVWFRINGQGLRADQDYPYDKPEGIKRIVSLGDSFTVGYEVETEQAFSSVIERELKAQGIRVEVLNAGVSGFSTAEECLYLERELFRYDPDLVMVSFFGNDLVDNVRSGLFRLEGDKLVEAKETYVPAGRLGNFLNTNPLFNLLSERSNAFALLKERATRLMARRMVKENVQHLNRADGEEPPAVATDDANTGQPAPTASTPAVATADNDDTTQPAPAETAPAVTASDDAQATEQRDLAVAIFERIYAKTRAAGIPLVIQSIPTRLRDPERLIELFPVDGIDLERKGLRFFAAKEALDPWVERELLYNHRSHGHWTPRAHEVAGRALATIISKEGLLVSDSASR